MPNSTDTPPPAAASTPTPTVSLRDGTLLQRHIAQAYWVELRAMYRDHPFALYEAWLIARNPEHKPAGDTGLFLRERGILDRRGMMHPMVRSIVRSAIRGVDIMDMRLTVPFDGAT